MRKIVKETFNLGLGIFVDLWWLDVLLALRGVEPHLSYLTLLEGDRANGLSHNRLFRLILTLKTR